MPRVKQAECVTRKNVAVATILEALASDGKEWDYLHTLLGVSESTARNRRKNPDSFTLGELRKLRLTNRQYIQLIRGKVI